MSSRAKRGICCSLALAADHLIGCRARGARAPTPLPSAARLLGVARAVRALLLLSLRQLAYWVSRARCARSYSSRLGSSPIGCRARGARAPTPLGEASIVRGPRGAGARVQRARLQISFCERHRADPSKNPFPLPLATRSPAFDFGTHIPQANADASCSENQGVVDSVVA